MSTALNPKALLILALFGLLGYMAYSMLFAPEITRVYLSIPEITNKYSGSKNELEQAKFILENTNILLSSKQVVLKNHSIENHNWNAIKAQQCLIDPNKIIFYNAMNNRFIVSCKIDDHTWGVTILEKIGNNFEEVTSYTKDRAWDAIKFINRMKNIGYNPIDYFLR